VLNHTINLAILFFIVYFSLCLLGLVFVELNTFYLQRYLIILREKSYPYFKKKSPLLDLKLVLVHQLFPMPTTLFNMISFLLTAENE